MAIATASQRRWVALRQSIWWTTRTLTGYSQVVNGAVTRTYSFGRQLISENQLINGAWKPGFYGYDGHGNGCFPG